MIGLPDSLLSLPRPQRRHLQGMACGLLMALALPSLMEATAKAQGAPTLDTTAVGAVVGKDVAQRWCNGEDPRGAVEQALLSYLSSQKIGPEALPEKTTEALGKEIAIEAFAQAFTSCPQQARQVFRTMMD